MEEKLTDEQKRIIEDNAALVGHIVKKFSDVRVTKSEFMSAGYFGLLKAARTFNPELGTKFSTYAGKCITNSILDLLGYAKRNYGRHHSLDDAMIENSKGVISTYADMYDDGIRIEEEVLQKVELEERKLIIGLYLLNKSPRYAHIVRLRLQEGKTHEVIAQEIGISKSYISRILTKIEKELYALKRKIDITEGDYFKRYSAQDMLKAKHILDEPPKWIIQIDSSSNIKDSVIFFNPIVNFLHNSVSINKDLINLINPDSDQVEIMLTRTSDIDGIMVIKFRSSDTSYFFHAENSSACIESVKLTEWLLSNEVVFKKYNTCYYDDQERTLYVKVECAPNEINNLGDKEK